MTAAQRWGGTGRRGPEAPEVWPDAATGGPNDPRVRFATALLVLAAGVGVMLHHGFAAAVAGIFLGLTLLTLWRGDGGAR